MRRFLLYLRGWIDEPYNIFVVGGLFVVVLMAIALHYREVYPNSIWITILAKTPGILFFALLYFAGITSIRTRTLPISILPVQGVSAVILGAFLALGSGWLAIFILVKTVSLLASMK